INQNYIFLSLSLSLILCAKLPLRPGQAKLIISLSLSLSLIKLWYNPENSEESGNASGALGCQKFATLYSILMNGQNAKTNFPSPQKTSASNCGDDDHDHVQQEESNIINGSGGAGPLCPKALSELLSIKLRKCCKDPSPSLTCLRLDNDNSHIGVWQKRAGSRAGSDWVMRIELGSHNK
ncbi:hypothetical protein F8388_012389, partial [Cannabis sativa]